MRKIISVLLILMMIVLMSGCNIKEKISESISEKLIEEAAGDGTDVDINGEDVTVSTDEGEFSIDDENGMTFEGEDGSIVQSGGEYEWPKDQAAAYLPKLNAGTVTYILNSAESCMLTVSEVSEKDYKKYKDDIIGEGYTNNTTESNAEDMLLYSGSTSDGVALTVFYTPSQETISITLDASAKQ